MKQIKLVDLKPGMVFNDSLSCIDDVSDFYLPAYSPLELHHFTNMVRQGIHMLNTNGEVIRRIHISLYDRPNSIRELLVRLEEDRETYVPPSEFNFYDYMPAIERYSRFMECYESFQKTLFNAILPNQKIERVKKRMDQYIQNTYHALEADPLNFLTCASTLDLDASPLATHFRRILFGFYMGMLRKDPYQYLHYWAQAQMVLAYGDLPLKNEKFKENKPLQRIVQQEELYPEEVLQHLSRYYFKWGTFVDKLMLEQYDPQNNPKGEHRKRLANLTQMTAQVTHVLHQYKHPGLEAVLKPLTGLLGHKRTNEDMGIYLKLLISGFLRLKVA
jgi:hypothetical protein